MKRTCIVLLLLLLGGCAESQALFKKVDYLNVLISLSQVKHDFERGRIMRAREAVLSMAKDHRDYAAAHQFLKEKIEPARRRIFVHYLRKAKRLEAQHRWAAAMDAYAEAKAITIKPERMEKKRAEMEFKMRQLRLDRLLRQRRAEDAAWLRGLPVYEPPKGVSARDEVYTRQRESYNEALDDRADHAYYEAKHYLRDDLPEIAYVELESLLRLEPGSARALNLMQEVRAELPKQLVIRPIRQVRDKQATAKRKAVLQKVEAADIQAALKAGELLQARALLQRYRRSNGKDADKLVALVNKRINAKAAEHFAKGSEAFRKEKLDLAIEAWGEAAALKPEESEYVEALQRARQLKERLNLLQQQRDDDPVPEEE